MSIYDGDWREVPSGYYADVRTKVNYDLRRNRARYFNSLVEDELKKMGLSEEIPTEEQIERAEEAVKGWMKYV